MGYHNYVASPGPCRLLLVEDTLTDAYLLRRSLSNIEFESHVIEDGQQAVHYIDSLTPEAYPHLIVVDLNIPGYDGLQVLKHCRATPALAEVSIVMLTSSPSPRDRARAERLGVTEFLIKPMDLNEFMGLGTTLGKYLSL